MRFPVGDEFAIELATKLYELLTAEGQPLPGAVGITLKRLADRPAEEWFPALSMAAPAIFGATAPGLTLKAPPCTISAPRAAEHPKMADDFPPQTERFVGRTAVMTRASAALAPDSGISGVLFHGMPGGGKRHVPSNWATPTKTPSTNSSGSEPPMSPWRSVGP
jgi:hypothetical protein